jgi:hypothetical protein
MYQGNLCRAKSISRALFVGVGANVFFFWAAIVNSGHFGYRTASCYWFEQTQKMYNLGKGKTFSPRFGVIFPLWGWNARTFQWKKLSETFLRWNMLLFCGYGNICFLFLCRNKFHGWCAYLIFCDWNMTSISCRILNLSMQVSVNPYISKRHPTRHSLFLFVLFWNSVSLKSFRRGLESDSPDGGFSWVKDVLYGRFIWMRDMLALFSVSF